MKWARAWLYGWWCALAGLAALLPTSALAQTGVSDNQVSLPDGPGSIQGVGENASVDAKMGLMSWAMPIEVPAGFAGLTPSLSLSYSSGSGQSVVGMGWSLAAPTIERMTSRGLPEYDADDLFAVNGGTELVRLPGTNPPVFRERYEGSFIRYTWHAPGAEGYWTAEYPDGRVGYFGATADGAIVSAARSSGVDGTFRYHVVEVVDRFGHALRYDYDRPGNLPVLGAVGWVHDSGGAPTFSATFVYEERDDHLVDCKPGFCEALDQRLKTVFVRASGQVISRMALEYEDYAMTGGFTRLKAIRTFGADGGQYPVAFSFSYSQALGGLCTDASCEQPYFVDMGSVNADISSGNVTLVDINGDSLPDVVHTPVGARHRFIVSTLSTDGVLSWSNETTTSAFAETTGKLLSAGETEVLDINGDGFADMYDAKNRTVFVNEGLGDWTAIGQLGDGAPGLGDQLAGDFDVEDGDLGTTRFVDLDNDKRIDVLTSTATSTTAFRNDAVLGFVSYSGVQQIGHGFFADDLELADINGDGLLDPVVRGADQLQYRLNLGWGRWSDWKSVTWSANNAPYTPAERNTVAELEDINGDGLADVVVVNSGEVRYALSRNGSEFLAPVRITSAGGRSVPTRTGKTVLFADMNGNGSSDIVWIDASGNTTVLELFPLRPNLLTRIDNGIGAVTDITYGTTIEHCVRDAAEGSAYAWSYPSPTPSNVVDRSDSWERLNQVHDVTDFRYHDSFYDGRVKQFRGFATVETINAGDANAEVGREIETYDVGITDPYRDGVKLSVMTFSADREISVMASTFEDCPIADVDDIPVAQLTAPIRYVCQTREVKTVKEGAAASEWVTTEKSWERDGYGNVTREIAHGVTSRGGAGCGECSLRAGETGAPCDSGAGQCIGDELYTETSFIAPGTATDGLWLVDAPIREMQYADPANRASAREMVYGYDGETPFVPLSEGQLTLGLPTEIRARLADGAGADAFVTQARMRYDSDGNLAERIGPRGQSDGTEDHQQWFYDGVGLKNVRASLGLLDADGAPYAIQNVYGYEPRFQQIAAASNDILVRGTEQLTPQVDSFAFYDEFGRLKAKAMAGDTAATPTLEYTYDLGSTARPYSRILTHERVVAGGPLGRESVACLDGFGRAFQARTQVGDGEYLVNGFSVFNGAGQPVRTYNAYTGTSGACDLTPPAGVPFKEYRYDGTGRVIELVLPDGEIYGAPSAVRTRYLPLGIEESGPDDNDPSSPNANTPGRTFYDGLERVVRVERLLTAGGPPLVDTLFYAEHGDGIARHVDPAGNEKIQTYDRLGRIISVDDPDRGTITYERDADGLIVRQTDARGSSIRREFDARGRLTSIWDEAKPEETRATFQYDFAAGCPNNACTHTAGLLAGARYPLNGGPGEQWFGYDIRGQGTWHGHTIDGHLFEVTSTFDNAGDVLTAGYPGGLGVAFEYDAGGRLARVPGIVEAVHYAPGGELRGLDYANGTSAAWTHDAVQRPATLAITDGAGAAVAAYGYTWDRVNNAKAIADTANHPAVPSGAGEYTYDAMQRLVSAKLPTPQGGATEQTDYRYDNLDNLLSRTSDAPVAGTVAYFGDLSYGAAAGPRAVTGLGDDTYKYDAAGNLTSRGDDSLDWDFLGRLTRVTMKGGTTVEFDYGVSSERVARRHGGRSELYVTSDFEVRDGVAVLNVTALGQSIATVESAAIAASLLSDLAPATVSGGVVTSAPDGVITAADGWLAAAVDSGALSLAEGTASDAEALFASSARRLLVEAGDTTWLHTNHQGTVVATSDDEGAVIEGSSYYPFGANRGGRADSDEAAYAGKPVDADTGLTYFGARYLDNHSGRWTSPDPAFANLEDDGIERLREASCSYAYGLNNPVSFVDPDGNIVVLAVVVGALGATGGAAAAAAGKAAGIAIIQAARTRLIARLPVDSPRRIALEINRDTQESTRKVEIASAAVVGGITGAVSLGLGGVASGVSSIVSSSIRAGFARVGWNPDGKGVRVFASLVGYVAGGLATGGVGFLTETAASIASAFTGGTSFGQKIARVGSAIVEVLGGTPGVGGVTNKVGIGIKLGTMVHSVRVWMKKTAAHPSNVAKLKTQKAKSAKANVKSKAPAAKAGKAAKK